MGQYNKAVLTTAGEKLIARALAGEIKLNITKAKTSSYAYPSGTDFKSLTDMKEIMQAVADPTTTVYNNTIIQTRVLFSNEEITSTYYIYNIGLYAMDGTQEVLFCIVTAETPDEMPQYNGVASTSYIYNIQNVVQDATELNIAVNPSGTATIKDVLERVDVTGGDISETVIETLDTIEDKYPVPAAGESVKRFLGKVLTFLRNIRPLTDNITLYVSVNTGSDIMGDGSQSKPFKSIQHAIDILPRGLGDKEVIINVADGIYDEDLLIRDFYGGVLRIYSSNISSISNVCSIKSFFTSNCFAYIFIAGFNITTITRHAIQAYNTHEILVRYCSAVGSTSDWAGFRFAESHFQIWSCVVSNKNIALHAYKSYGTSDNWGSTSGNNIGAYSEYGSIITTIGAQARGTTLLKQSRGGMFTYGNGAQIAGPFASGLSCAWGTIYGGYFRHGNYINGEAMVNIQIRVVLSSALTAYTEYYINGFPNYSIMGAETVAVTTHTPAATSYCYLKSDGRITFAAVRNFAVGEILFFNADYPTNS